MSTDGALKKRKSVDGTAAVVKRAKTSKFAEKPAPLKSAMKKSEDEATKNVQKPLASSQAKTKTKTSAQGRAANKSAAADIVIDNEVLNDTAELTQDQTAALMAGFSSSDEDEADADEDAAGIDLSAMPSIPTTSNSQRQIAKATNSKVDDVENTPGVIYIGRIPHGFYEAQMRAYFSQFGTITNLRLARNRKTGRSQHWAFVEFASAAVADIVARTMDKYLLFGHLLQVRRIPSEQVDEKMWRTGARGGRKPVPRNKLEGSALKRGKTREQWETRIEKEKRKRAEKAEVLKQMGYDFEMPALKSVADLQSQSQHEAKKLAEDDRVEENVAQGTAQAQIESELASAVSEQPVTKKRAAGGKPKSSKKAVKKVKA